MPSLTLHFSYTTPSPETSLTSHTQASGKWTDHSDEVGAYSAWFAPDLSPRPRLKEIIHRKGQRLVHFGECDITSLNPLHQQHSCKASSLFSLVDRVHIRFRCIHFVSL